MADPLFMYKLKNGLLGTPDTAGGLIDQEQARAAQNNGLMNFGASLLQASGPSPVPTGLGQALGGALLAGRQGQQQSLDSSLKTVLLKKQLEAAKAKQSPFGLVSPNDYTPASLKKFQETGNYGDLVPSSAGMNIGNFNPGDYTPESFAKFRKSGNIEDLVRYVAPANPSVQVVNGVPTVVTPNRGSSGAITTPLSNLNSEAEAKSRLKAAEEVGKISGEITGGKEKRASNAELVSKQLDLVEPLLDVATGSAGGAALDKVAGFFGFAPDGATANAQLAVVQATLIQNMPRLEGPQSDKDAQLYREAAGQIANPNVPTAIRKAAVKTVRQIQEKYGEAKNNGETKKSAATKVYNPATGKIENATR